jgi:lycopene beta-cyclase
MPTDIKADIVLAGGGLANGLLAYRLSVTRPDLSILLLERDEEPGGNHTWSFHAADLDTNQHAWISPFVTCRWGAQEVHFPNRTRRLAAGYRSIASERFRVVLRDRLRDRIVTGATVEELSATEVRLTDGRRIGARAVVDGMGRPPEGRFMLGYQKFVGLELELAEPHGLDAPIIMDARVEQQDGYRFVYVLPFSPKSVLVEDTYYSDAPDLSRDVVRQRVRDYVSARGWPVRRILREEAGVLPIVMAGDFEGFLTDGTPGVARTGLAGAFCHPVTGYSLPDAVRVADLVAGLSDLSGPAIAQAVEAYARERWRQQRFLRLLSRMLFLAADPGQRRRVMERFYGLPEALISRFYAGSPTFGDKARTLSGRPPVPIRRALPLLDEAAVMRRAGVGR